MKPAVCASLRGVALSMGILVSFSAHAEIEEARDLMEEGHFAEAREALWPAARSGNAEAEELIGVMYALGLGVERDSVRAMEFLSGRVETVIVEPGGADAPVMEHEPHLMRAEVP